MGVPDPQKTPLTLSLCARPWIKPTERNNYAKQKIIWLKLPRNIQWAQFE